jgi:predicted hydrocarbon binding protein
VRISESACTAGQVSSHPHCAFTMGVFIGAIHALTGSRVKGTEIQCCAMGADQCIYQIDPV